MNSLIAQCRRMTRFLLRRGWTREDAEDLIQEAFLRMQTYCERGGEVREPGAFHARIVTRLAINALRDRHGDLYSDQSVEALTFLVDTQPLPDEVLSADECLTKMRDALDGVSRRTRDVFFMHRLDGLSYGEIARELGISVSAVEKRMARAMVTLSEANYRE